MSFAHMHIAFLVVGVALWYPGASVQVSSMCPCVADFPHLMALYNATNGPGWVNSSGWGRPASDCGDSWFGVLCDGAGYTFSISLAKNGLSGTLPQQLGSLLNLASLDLSSNNLYGALPESWASMTRIQVLLAHSNGLSGTLPSSWSAMTNLMALHLYNNKLTGPLPPAWGNQASKLVLLLLTNNSLEGTFPMSWTSMSSITFMSVDKNCLYGWMPRNMSAVGRTLVFCNTKLWMLNVLKCSDWLPSYCNWNLSTSVSASTTVANNLRTRTWSNSSTRSLVQTAITSSATGTRTAPTQPTSTIASSISSLSIMSSSPTMTSLLTSSKRVSHSATTQTNEHSSSTTCSAAAAAWNCSDFSAQVATVAIAPVLDPSVFFLFANTSVFVVESNVAVGTPIVRRGSRDPATVSIVARSVARATVLARPQMLLNISITTLVSESPAVNWAQWRVASVTPAQSWAAIATSDSRDPVNFVVLVLTAPEDGWISSTTPLLSDAGFVVAVTFACGNNSALEVYVEVPAPGAARDYAAQVETAGRYSQIASILAGGASSGSALGRVMATRSMVICDAAAAVGGGVIDFGVHICSKSALAATTRARSAIVSNSVLLLCVAILLLTLAAAWACVCGVTMRSATRTFCLPSSLMPVWVATLPSTASSVTLLFARLASSKCAAVDVMLALCGGIIAVVPVGLLIVMWQCSTPHWGWTSRKVAPDKRSIAARALGWVLHRGMRRNWHWSGDKVVDAAWVVLLEYRVLWYAAVDTGALLMLSANAVISGLGGRQGMCYAWSAVTMIILVGQLALLVCVRPLTTIFSMVHSCVTLLLTCVSALAQLLFIVVSSGSSSTELWLVDVSEGCNLAVVGVSAVKMALDALQLIASVRRRVEAIQQHLEQNRSQCDEKNVCLTDVDATTASPPLTHQELRVSPSNSPPVMMFGGSFAFATSFDQASQSQRLYAVNTSFASVRSAQIGDDLKSSTNSGSNGGGTRPPPALLLLGNSFASSNGDQTLRRTEGVFWDGSGLARVNPQSSTHSASQF